MEATHYLSKFDSSTEYTTIYTFVVGHDRVIIERRSAVAEDEDCSPQCPDFGGARNVQRETLDKGAARQRYSELRAAGYR
jgi:hypothetical protein